MVKINLQFVCLSYRNWKICFSITESTSPSSSHSSVLRILKPKSHLGERINNTQKHYICWWQTLCRIITQINSRTTIYQRSISPENRKLILTQESLMNHEPPTTATPSNTDSLAQNFLHCTPLCMCKPLQRNKRNRNLSSKFIFNVKCSYNSKETTMMNSLTWQR